MLAKGGLSQSHSPASEGTGRQSSHRRHQRGCPMEPASSAEAGQPVSLLCLHIFFINTLLGPAGAGGGGHSQPLPPHWGGYLLR